MTTGCDPFWFEEYEQALNAGLQSHRTRQGTDMKMHDMLPSNYLKQADFDEGGSIVTIDKIENANIAMEGKPVEMKWLLYFTQFDKPMVLNSTNIQLLAKACASEDTDDWIGKEVIVYVDPNVSFGGELVGGLRIRKHQVAAPKRVAPRAATAAPKSDSQAFSEQEIPD